MSDATVSDGLHLGRGMARRSRSQSVLAMHRTAATLVGAVGRASVGFGLAIGRSRAIRPIVNLSDVNSAALRPPTNFWREPISDYEIADTGIDSSVIDESAIGARIPVERRLVRRSTNPGQQSVSRASAAPSSVSRRSRRPTWTDQIIQRSAVGYTSAPTGSLVERPAVPDDFIPFGDAAVDHLRLLMRAHESSSAQTPATARQAARRSERDSERADHMRAERNAGGSQIGAQRGDTAAGRSTGPGRLAKAMRPEHITSQSTTGVSARPGPGSTVGADLPVAGRRKSSGAVLRSPHRAADAPSRMDTLRALLVDQGILSAGSEDARPPASSDVVPADGVITARGTTGGATTVGAIAVGPARVVGAATTSADLARSVQRSAQQRRDVRSAPPSAESALEGRGSRQPASSPQAAPTGSAPTGSAPTGSNGGPVATAESMVGRSRANGPDSPRDETGLRRRALRMVSTTSEPARRDAAGGQRPDRNVDGTVAETPDMQSDPSTRFEQVGSAGLQRTSEHGTHRALPWTPQQPVLRSLSPTTVPGVAVLRRVTLPRALSFSHRPAPTLGVARLPSIGVAGAVRREPGSAGIGDRAVGAFIAQVGVDGPTGSDRAETRPVVDRPDTVVSDRPRSVRASVAPLVESETSRARIGGAAPAADIRRATTDAHVDRRRSVLAASSGALGQAIQRRAAMTEPASSPVRQGSVRPVAGTPLVLATSTAGTTAPATPTMIAPTVAAPTIGTPTGGTTAPALPTAGTPTVAAPEVGAPTTGAAAISRRESATTTTVARSAPSPGWSALDAGVARAPAERLADQFMTELSQTIRRTAAPLPMPYRPMADTITGGRRVMLSTDGASRRALRSVGKVAATTDNTIHLDTGSVAPGRMSEVIAHELTHVAHPSPRPRFFDDIDHSPEERQAEQVAKIMARSPLAPSASVVTPVGVERRAASTIRRSPVFSQSPAPAPGTVDAVSLAARITGASGSPGSAGSPMIRRELVESPTSSPSSPTPSPGSSGDRTASQMSDHEFLNLVRANLPDVVGMIEDRLIIELERRGGRTWGVL